MPRCSMTVSNAIIVFKQAISDKNGKCSSSNGFIDSESYSIADRIFDR